MVLPGPSDWPQAEMQAAPRWPWGLLQSCWGHGVACHVVLGCPESPRGSVSFWQLEGSQMLFLSPSCCCSHLPTPLPGAEIPLVLQAHLKCHLLLVATPVTSFHGKFTVPSEPQGLQEYLLAALKTASPRIPGRIEAERPRAAETEAGRLRPPPLSLHPTQSLQPNPAGATGRGHSDAKDPCPAPTGHQKLD